MGHSVSKEGRCAVRMIMQFQGSKSVLFFKYPLKIERVSVSQQKRVVVIFLSVSSEGRPALKK